MVSSVRAMSTTPAAEVKTFDTLPNTIPTQALPFEFKENRMVTTPTNSIQEKMWRTEKNDPRFVFDFGSGNPYVVQGVLRGKTGKYAARYVRMNGFVPCVINSATNNQKCLPIGIEGVELERLGRLGAPHSIDINIVLKGMTEPIRVTARNWIKDPITGKTVHVQFIAVEETRERDVIIPVKLTGVEDCIGTKRGAMLLTPSQNIKVTYNPRLASQFGIDRPPRMLVLDVVDRFIGSSIQSKHVPLPPFMRMAEANSRHVLLTFTKSLG